MPMRVADSAVRAYAAAATAATLAVTATSGVERNLWVVSGTPAEVFAVGYCIALAWLAVDPRRLTTHLVAGGLGSAYWMGRAGGFAEIVADGRTDLIGAVAERAAMLAAAVAIHMLYVIVAGTVDDDHHDTSGGTDQPGRAT